MSSSFFYIVACARLCFLFKAEYYSIVYGPHFVCLFISQWYLAYFPLLVIVNNVDRNMGVQVSLPVSAFNSFGYIFKGELLDHTVILFLIFWETIIWFSLEATLYNPINNTQRFQFLHIFTCTCYICCHCGCC